MRDKGFAAVVALIVAVIAGATAADVSIVPVTAEAAKYWPRWRGPSGQGLVAGTNYVDSWSDTTNVKWRVAVPGRGHSSPIVWGNRIFLTTEEEGGAKLSMLAFDRADGKLLWQTAIPTSGVVEHVYIARTAVHRRRRRRTVNGSMRRLARTVWRHSI